MGGQWGVGLWDLCVFKLETCPDQTCIYGGEIPHASQLEIKHNCFTNLFVKPLFRNTGMQTGLPLFLLFGCGMDLTA